tara:strand:+ start:3191 stop:4042 length:852 start_codon:yes stop_codon:yes gene_type:complete
MKHNISIVIATNNPKLINIFLNNLFSNSILPSEIIIVIPLSKEYLFNFSNKYIENIKIFKSQHENQVIQRIEGFVIAKCDYVLQIDDDIIYKSEAINILLNNLKHHENACIGPSISEKGKINTWMNNPDLFNSKLYTFISYLNNGKKKYRSGGFSLAGINMNFDLNLKNKYEVDWLPGGCILHKKNNLILDNYYPYNRGKSFSEDLFHSKEISKKGIKLFYSPDSKLFLSNQINNNLNFSSILNIIKSIKVMNIFVLRYGGNLLRLNIVLLMYYFWLFLHKLK